MSGAGPGGRRGAATPAVLIRAPRRAVLRKASALEYKIQRRALRKEDFINYIQVGFADEQRALTAAVGAARLEIT